MLSEFQKKKLTRYFRVYDVDDDGVIGPTDFERVVENLRVLHGLDPDSSGHRGLRSGYTRRWEAVCASADADEDGTVDLTEWLIYWDGVLEDADRFADEVSTLAERLFDFFDLDEDDRLGPDEFCDFFAAYGLGATIARQIFVDLDLDGDGAISRREMVLMAQQFFRSDDPEAPGSRLFGPVA